MYKLLSFWSMEKYDKFTKNAIRSHTIDLYNELLRMEFNREEARLLIGNIKSRTIP